MPRRPRLNILYCSISNNNVTLVSHQNEVAGCSDSDEALEEVLAEVLETTKYYNELDNIGVSWKAHFLIDRGIIFTCITKFTDSHYLPFAFLHDVREKFSEQPSLISRSYRAGEDEFDRDFRPVLVQIMDDFNSGRADKISQVDEQIEDIKEVMLQNVEKIMERADALADLLSKTEDLKSQGVDFRVAARQVFVQSRCRNLKLWLVILFLFSLFVTIVILFVTGVIKT
ncbi:hypothetical protein ONE63_002351 [Megalurothrips usitatus]|uniref:Vesicle-associated membrane protein 7 n=1 Tax=Megalurothrips usitatus TaxID=439358 RepID=A0AAV7XAX2_9NEOP|nr:hypothetical protein ONE63_002350 [Megalurothrips usitatus]KAJ1522033.1 hypothetical protein ONE63_002351 [Megalurothrips usitatus]